MPVTRFLPVRRCLCVYLLKGASSQDLRFVQIVRQSGWPGHEWHASSGVVAWVLGGGGGKNSRRVSGQRGRHMPGTELAGQGRA